MKELELQELYGKPIGKKRASLLKKHWPKQIPLVPVAFYNDRAAYEAQRSQAPGWGTADIINEERAGMLC